MAIVPANGDNRAFQAMLVSLRGWRCVKASAGYGTGSRLLLHFASVEAGADYSRIREEERVELFVECSWRLRTKQEVVTSAWAEDIDDETGFVQSMIRGCERLIGEVLIETQVLDTQTMDLRVQLSNSLTLDVFCDVVHNVEDDNYSFGGGDTLWRVSERSGLIQERGEGDA